MDFTGYRGHQRVSQGFTGFRAPSRPPAIRRFATSSRLRWTGEQSLKVETLTRCGPSWCQVIQGDASSYQLVSESKGKTGAEISFFGQFLAFFGNKRAIFADFGRVSNGSSGIGWSQLVPVGLRIGRGLIRLLMEPPMFSTVPEQPNAVN